MILAGTGHRPEKLGGYGADVFQRLYNLAYDVLGEQQPSLVLSGMALGWDQALALAANVRGIPFHAYVPFAEQEKRWSPGMQANYHELLRVAEKVVVTCPGTYAAWKMQKRNEAMVDASDRLAVLWDGTRGGTGNCVSYAERVGREMFNVWERWIAR